MHINLNTYNIIYIYIYHIIISYGCNCNIIVWLRYIDNIFFIWTHGEAEIKKFMEGLNNFLPNLKFT